MSEMARLALDGKQVLVIGGASGIGLAIAQWAAREGAYVTITDPSSTRLDRAGKLIDGDATLVVVDPSVEAAVCDLFARYSSIDHVVVAPGRLTTGLVVDIDITEAQRTMDRLFWAQLFVARHVGSRIARDGSLTLFSCQAGYRPTAGLGIAAAASAAVGALGMVLALEFAPVRVNVIAPGAIDTRPHRDVAADPSTPMSERIRSTLPVGRLGSPDDVASTVIQIMQNGFMTGSVIHIDGGGLL